MRGTSIRGGCWKRERCSNPLPGNSPRLVSDPPRGRVNLRGLGRSLAFTHCNVSYPARLVPLHTSHMVFADETAAEFNPCQLLGLPFHPFRGGKRVLGRKAIPETTTWTAWSGNAGYRGQKLRPSIDRWSRQRERAGNLLDPCVARRRPLCLQDEAYLGWES